MPFFSNTVPLTYNKTERLDKFIANVSPEMNRSKLKSGVVSILVNGKSQKVSYKVKPGDQIDIQWEENIPNDIEPQNIPLNIIYEDANVCVVDKKQGMVTHPACGNWDGTLVNALLYHWGRQAIKEIKDSKVSSSIILANRRPGIVHRLDKETSGIIITAKNRSTEEYLASLFRDHKKIKKEYICICMGRPQHQHGKIATQIIRDPRDRKKFRAVENSSEGKYAETHYSCIACYGEFSLMRVRIVTGRTHQIRVHMKFLNCPILGDGLYSKQDKKFPYATLMLDAHKLSISLPDSKEIKVFKNKTPVRFKKILRVLHRDYSKVILPKDR